MAFTTSDNFTYMFVFRFTNLIRGSCLQGQEIRMVIFSVIILDKVDTQRLKLVRKHIRIGKYSKRHGH